MRLKPSIKLLLFVLLLIGAVVSAWPLILAGVPFRRESLRTRLLSSIGSVRPVEGRLLDQPYAPYESTKSPMSEQSRFQVFLKDKKISQIDVAILKLLEGSLDDAIDILEELCRSSPNKAQCLNDLPALYLARSKEDDLVKALKILTRAWMSGNAPPETYFNQALCFEKLSLTWSARKSWLRYIKLDPDSPWRDEAEAHLRRLGESAQAASWEETQKALENAALAGKTGALESLVYEHTQVAREFGEERLLGNWGAAWSQGRYEDANSMLVVAREIGLALSRRRGDEMLLKSVVSIDHASRNRSRLRLGRLARGHYLYVAGLAALEDSDFIQARQILDESQKLLSSGGSEFAGWARLRLAVCNIEQFKFEGALADLKSLGAEAERGRYPSLQGAALWSIGLLRGIQGRPAEAAQAYHGASKLFGRLCEEENLSVINSLIASSFRDMGDESTAWHYEMAALRSLPDVREARKRFLVWDEAEFILRQSGDLGAALSFQDEIIAASSATSRPGLKVTSFEEKAAICDELGWREEAWKAVGAAKRHLVDIRDEAVRTNLSGDLMVAEAQLVAASDPERAVSLLNPALQFYGKRDYAYKLADLHFQRAQAYARMGSLDRAEADLIASIAGIEQQRRDIPEASIQEQFFEQAGRVFTLMAKVQLRLGRPQVALGYIERLRSKPSLISVDVSTKASVEIVDRVQRMLPTGTVIVDLVLLDNRIHVWILRRDLIRDFDLTSQASTISLKIKEYSDALSKSNENLCSRLSRELGNILLAEIMPSLESAKRVIFIPDGPLNKVPFAALQNPDTSHYLVQSYAIAVAPSAAVYAQAVSRAVSLGERFGSVLAVGDPDFDRSLWPSTKSLGEAREEVGQVAALYPRSKKLVGKEATIAEFEQSAQVYNVLHIAAHAFVNREQPLLSLLLFSPSASQGDAGALYVRDLYKLKLSETRLVVLAACSSLGEGSGGRYGLSSLARPFLAAGVPSVIGTLWPVGDYEALKFIVRFHKDLLLLGDPMRALQKTQVDSIAASGPRSSRNSVWAAFQILGS